MLDLRSLTLQLEMQGKLLGRRWALATSTRCRAHLAAVDGDLECARTACEQARHKPVARESLGRALGIFEHLGAPLWADKARRELSKIATGRPVHGLTDTERSIAGLIAQGQTNRQVASALFVTQNTVQTHVRHIFQKLGVRSRTELAARLLSTTASTARHEYH